MNEKSLALDALSKEFQKCLMNWTRPLQGAGEVFPALLRLAHPQAPGVKVGSPDTHNSHAVFL